MKKICGIYKITNKINGKIYIGQSINIFERWKHEKQNKQNNKHFTRAITKYGIENFSFEILEECEPNDLDDREIYYIKTLNSTDASIGYNIEDNAKSHNNWYIKLSEEERKKINLQRGLKQRSKILSEEHKKAISKSQKERHKTDGTKKDVFCLETNVIYESICSAAKENNIKDDSQITRCCNGLNNSANGKHFCWAADKETKKWNLKERKQIYQEKFGTNIFCVETQKIYKSINQAVEELSKLGYTVNKKGISRNIRGLQRHCGNLHFNEWNNG